MNNFHETLQPFLLGGLIDELKVLDKGKGVKFDFAYFRPDLTINSYRGFYERLALGYTDEDPYPTVAQVLFMLEGAVGKVYEGYKGGDYKMSRSTILHVAKYGDTGGTCIVGVHDETYVTLLTTIDEACY